MHYFITIQYPYEYLCVTLSSEVAIIESQTITKFKAVSKLIPTIQELLHNHNIHLNEISCFGINTGPGPFNTLRSIIATANGINFAIKTPLIECNSLEIMLSNSLKQSTVVILDACGSDVYYGIKQTAQTGYTSIDKLITMVNNLQNQTTYFIGNGIIKHQDLLKNNIQGISHFDTNFLFSSAESLYQTTKQLYFAGIRQEELYPLYFQSPVIK